MRLFVSGTSPFARKALMVIREKGLEDRIDLRAVDPWKNPPELVVNNPLSQVPTLVLDDGSPLFDSRVICAYLNELTPEPKLLPDSGIGRACVMRMEALADGLTHAAVNVRMTRLRQPGGGDNDETLRQLNKIMDGLEYMEADVGRITEKVHLGTIAYGAALGYLDFRFPDLGWRERAPELAVWYKDYATRPAMRETMPSE